VAHLYFSHQQGPYQVGQSLGLDSDEAHHAFRVARVTAGEKVLFGDGSGNLATVQIESVGADQVVGVVLETEVRPADEPGVWLAQALAKGDRDELAIQTATELGVSGVIPLAAARSVSRWRGDKAVTGVARWTKIVTQASKQSLRPWIPEVLEPHEPQNLAKAVPGAQIIVLHPEVSTALSDIDYDLGRPIVLVVGPEGGFDDAEIWALEHSGARIARLGSTVLRTSSAGPAALAVVNVKLGRW